MVRGRMMAAPSFRRGDERGIGQPLPDTPYLALHGLAKSYGDGKPAVAGIDLAAARGEFLTLLGPSGCGKTTVLRMIAGLVPPSAGRIAVDGVDITVLPSH